MMEENHCCLALSTISGLGPIRINKLLNYFSNASSIWRANEKDLKKVSGIGSLAKKIVKQREKFDINKLLNSLNKNKIEYITLFDKKYPDYLKNIYDPCLLYTSPSPRD